MTVTQERYESFAVADLNESSESDTYTICPYCDQPVTDGPRLGGRVLHENCMVQLDREMMSEAMR
mgnify:FL=1